MENLWTVSNCKEVRDRAKRIKRGHWSFPGLESKKSGMDRTRTNQKENEAMKPSL